MTAALALCCAVPLLAATARHSPARRNRLASARRSTVAPSPKISLKPRETQFPVGPLPGGVTAYVLNSDGSVATASGEQAGPFIPASTCGEYDCRDIARDKSGNFIIAGGAYLYGYDSAGNVLPNFPVPSGGHIQSVDLDAQGDYIAVDTSQNQVIRISHTTHQVTTIASFGVNSPSYDAFLRVDSSGNYILLEDSQADTSGPTPLTIYQITPGGTVTPIPVSITENTVMPVVTRGFTFDAIGNYIDVDPSNETIYTIAKAGSPSAGSASALFVDTSGYLTTPQGIARDPGSGRYFFGDSEYEALYSIAADGSGFEGIVNSQYFSNGPNALVLVVTVPPGNTDFILQDDFSVVGVGANAVTISCTDANLCNSDQYANDFAMDASGNFIIAGSTGLLKMTPSGTVSLIGPSTEWYSVAIDGSGNYLVTDPVGHHLERILAATQALDTKFNPPQYATLGTFDDAYVRIDSQGNYIVAEDSNGDGTGPVKIHKITPGGQLSDIVLSGTVPTGVGGMLIDSNGNYIISDWYNEEVISVAPSGAGTLLFSNGESGPLYDPAGSALETATGNFLVTNYDEFNLELQTTGSLFSMSPNGSSLTLVATGLNYPAAVLSVPFHILTTSLPSGAVGQAYSPVTLTAVSGTPSYTWSAGGLPSGMSVSPESGVLSGTPTSGGTFFVSIAATDSASHVASATLVLSISGGTAPPPPPSLNITTSTVPNGTVGVPYGPFGFSASGGNGVYSWSISGQPAGLGLSSSGVLSGTPAASGTFSFTVSVSSAGLFAQRSYSMSVALGPLSIQGPGNLGGFAPSAVISAAYTASGGSPPYQFSAPGIPTGLTIDASGHLTGAIAQPGNYNFTVEVTDSQPVTTGLNVSAFVLGINASSLPTASNNIPYQQTLSAVGGSAPYTWSLSGTLPTGLSLSGSGVLSGTPILSGTPAGPQTFTFGVSVTSGGVTTSKNLSLTVSLTPQPLSIPGAGGTPIALPDGALQAGYSQALQAAGGIPPYSWSYQAGTLPDGLGLDSSGNASGIPAKPGTFAFTGQVRDSAGATASAGFSIQVDSNPLRITNDSLPNAIAGTAYPTQAFGATGGIGPYTFTAKGALPAGLTFTNGQISGTPTTAGTSSFTVTVADSSGLTASSEFRIAVTPAHPDLILSQTSFSFSFNAGATVLPFGPSTAFASVSANTPQPLGFTTAITPAASWLSVSGGNKTPDTIGISLTNQALTLAAGTYKTSIVVTCAAAGLGASAPCAGSSQSIDVTLTVLNAPPQIVASPNTLSFFAQTANPQTLANTLILENAGGGSITVNSVTSAQNFISISGTPTTLAGSASAPVTVSVNSTGLSAGLHQGSILVTTSAGSVSVPVSILVSDGANMTLNPSGTQFQMVAGAAPGNPNGSFSVYIASNTSVNWNASVQPGASWLQLTNVTTSSSAASPGTVSYSINSAASSLAAGAYYGTIRVTSGGAVNSPQDYLVVLNVAPKTSLIQPDPEPGGLVFIYDGTTALPSQNVNVYAGSSDPLTYSVQSDSSWLSAFAATGTTSTGSPDTTRVSVDVGSLTPGIYRGGVSFQFTSPGASTDVRTVNVTLIYKGAPNTPAERTGLRPLQTSASCTPTALVPTQTGLNNSFSQPAAWPTPLKVQVVDNCGNAITRGQVVATFSNGDAPLALTAADATSGNYIGTWTPRNAASQITIAARASAQGFSPATIQIGGQVVPSAAPVLTPGGTLNAFAPVLGAAVAPGTIVQIYGSNLAGQPSIASAIPLPTKMNSTAVLIGGMLAPLYYVSSGQINAQVPFELAAGKQYQVIVNANGALSTPIPLLVSAAAPGIAGFPAGQVIAQHLDGRLVNDDAPAAPGEVVVFYVAGMGLTNQNVASGAGSPSTELATPLDTPAVTLGDIPVTDILFAGLTPTLVGLYQVDFRVPANTPNGDLTLVLTQTNGQSNATVMAVHN